MHGIRFVLAKDEWEYSNGTQARICCGTKFLVLARSDTNKKKKQKWPTNVKSLFYAVHLGVRVETRGRRGEQSVMWFRFFLLQSSSVPRRGVMWLCDSSFFLRRESNKGLVFCDYFLSIWEEARFWTTVTTTMQICVYV